MDSGQWDDRYSTAELVWTAQANRFVVEALADVPPGTALDLGAGEGRNAVWLAERGWQVTAVDFSAVGLAKAAELARRTGVSVVCEVADVTRYAPPAAVDLVLLSYLQLPDPQRTELLGRVPQWLRPGGRVLVVAHDKANVARGWGGPPDPRVCYSAEATAAALAPLMIEAAGVRQREVPGADRPALDTVVLARRPDGPADA